MNKINIIPYEVMDAPETKELSSILKRFYNKVNINLISKDEKVDKDINILYNNRGDGKWLQDFWSEEMIVVNNLDDLVSVLDFYSKYDYKTLNK